jgi:hypothetical protein
MGTQCPSLDVGGLGANAERHRDLADAVAGVFVVQQLGGLPPQAASRAVVLVRDKLLNRGAGTGFGDAVANLGSVGGAMAHQIPEYVHRGCRHRRGADNNCAGRRRGTANDFGKGVPSSSKSGGKLSTHCR